MSRQVCTTNTADMPQCRVCMDEFQASGPKKPKVLPCQHTFCRECLRSMEIEGKIECPLCRGVCQKAIEELPNSLLRLQLNDLSGTSSPNAPDEPASPTPVVDDMISALRICYTEPDKVLPQLKAFRHARKTAQFQAEHVMMVMLCMEHYSQNPLQQPDIIIVCIQIVHDMVSCGLGMFMSFAVQEKLHSDIFDVLAVSNTIRTGLRSPCIDILFGLSKDDVQKNYTYDNARILFEFLNESLQPHEDIKLMLVLWRFARTLDVATKENVGTREHVKIVLEKIGKDSAIDSSYLSLLISVLISFTDVAAVPCRNIVAEGGLNIIKRLLEEQTHQNDVMSSGLMLLSNISEIPDLRKDIIKNTSLVEAVVCHLHSENIEASIQSASTIANLSFVQSSEWLELCGTNNIRTTALAMMGDLVLVWIAEDPVPDCLPFTEKSFMPYFALLQLYSAPPCQLYAAWLIRKCCTDDKERYQKLLIEEDGVAILFAIKENESADESLRKVVEDILLSIS